MRLPRNGFTVLSLYSQQYYSIRRFREYRVRRLDSDMNVCFTGNTPYQILARNSRMNYSISSSIRFLWFTGVSPIRNCFSVFGLWKDECISGASMRYATPFILTTYTFISHNHDNYETIHSGSQTHNFATCCALAYLWTNELKYKTATV